MGFDKDNCLTAPYVSTIYTPFQVNHCLRSFFSPGNRLIYMTKDAWNNCKETFSKENVIIVSNSAGTDDDEGYKDKSNT